MLILEEELETRGLLLRTGLEEGLLGQVLFGRMHAARPIPREVEVGILHLLLGLLVIVSDSTALLTLNSLRAHETGGRAQLEDKLLLGVRI